VLHRYKTRGTYGDKSLKLKNVILKKFLDKSFKMYPRQYLLGIDKPMGYSLFSNILKRSFGSGMGTDMLRSIYISEFIKSNPTIKMREELANQMLHSVASQQLFYDKKDKDHVDKLPTPKQDTGGRKKELSSSESDYTDSEYSSDTG
jgi:hypothetical protein